MTNPCEQCKRKTCPERCMPKIDYLRGQRKKKHRAETHHVINDGTYDAGGEL